MVFTEAPEVLSCEHPRCRETVWTSMPEADDWDRWTFADRWVVDLCRSHAEEVRQAATTYAEALARKLAIEREVWREAGQYYHPWTGLCDPVTE